jgi:ribosomal protein L5
MPYKDKARESNKRYRLRHKEEIAAKAKIHRTLEDKDRRRASVLSDITDIVLTGRPLN